MSLESSASPGTRTATVWNSGSRPRTVRPHPRSNGPPTAPTTSPPVAPLEPTRAPQQDRWDDHRHLYSGNGLQYAARHSPSPSPSPSSPESVVTKLIDDPKDAAFCIYELGRFGKQALSSGPHVLRYLHSSSWQERVDAANTLGLIAYAEAIPSLVQALDIAHDWQLVFAAARSLARLGATDQVDRLKQVAAAHWYPPVRKLVGQAVDWLESGEAPTTWAWQTSRFSIWREQPPLCVDRCDAATSKASEAHPFRQGCTGIPLVCAKR